MLLNIFFLLPLSLLSTALPAPEPRNTTSSLEARAAQDLYCTWHVTIKESCHYRKYAIAGLKISNAKGLAGEPIGPPAIVHTWWPIGGNGGHMTLYSFHNYPITMTWHVNPITNRNWLHYDYNGYSWDDDNDWRCGRGDWTSGPIQCEKNIEDERTYDADCKANCLAHS